MIIIGRFYPMKQAGYFAQANKYSETVNAATQGILNYSVFPMFSTIQDDKERSLRIYRKLTVSTSLLTFPLVAFLMIAAEPIIITLISEKWINSIMMFQLLLLANLFTPLYTINISVLNAGGESVNTLKLEIIKKSFITLSVFATFSFGIHWMLAGFVFANMLAYLFSMFYIKKSLQHYYRHQVLDIVIVLLIVAFTGAICYFANFLNMNYIYKLIVLTFSFLIIYVGLLIIFKREVVVEIAQKITKTILRK
jgi:O-antigen/teichoic acid export membrane protein